MFLRRDSGPRALVPALTVFSLATIFITFFGKSVDNILGFTMFLDSTGMSTSAAALFYLRKNNKKTEHGANGQSERLF